MKANVIVALLLGLVLGFAVGKIFQTPSAAPAAAAGAPAAPGQQAAQQPARRNIDPTAYKVPVDGSPAQGRADALITVVEFSDYQCPFCSRANGTVKQLQELYGDKVRVVMKQLPLDMHPNARPAALAALAAGQQGKYWEMHEKLFANQRQLDDASLVAYAKDLGLDLAKFEADRKDAKLTAQMEADMRLASSLGVNGTPGFFINGRKISGAVPVDVFKQVIDEELPKAQALVNAGTPASEVYAKLQANAATAPAPAAAPPPQAPQFAKIDVPADSPSYGPKNAKVTIVEWSDFQCPFCSRALPTLAQIKETYPKDVRIVFRHQPLSFHQNAQIAAEAAMAAHEQGKFWQMHDTLFQNQKALDRASLEGYAKQLGLDVNKFKAALDGGKFKAQIARDSQTGMAVGAGGTPTFFINGRKVVGALPFASFKPIIDEELAKADKLLASGVKADKLYETIIEQNAGGAAQAKNVP